MSWLKLSTKIRETQTGFVEDKNILRDYFLPNLYRYRYSNNIYILIYMYIYREREKKGEGKKE